MHILRTYTAQTPAEHHETDEPIPFAREFLRKFFQVTLRLPEILDIDYERFVTNQVSLTGAKGLLSDRVQDIALIAYGRETPRKIKRFINDFLAYYALADSLESSGELAVGTLTKHLEFLAQIVVIFQEWPHEVDRLKTNPDLLTEATQRLRRDEDLSEEYSLPSGLTRFLRATRDIDVPDNILPFIYLKRAEYERDPELVAQVTEALSAGDFSQLISVLQSTAERADQVAEIAIRILRQWVARRRLPALNGVRCALGARYAVPNSSRAEFFSTIWNSLRQLRQGDTIEEWTAKLDPNAVLTFSNDLPDWQAEQLIEDYLEAFDPAVPWAAIHEGLLEALINQSAALSAAHKDWIKVYLTSAYAQNEESVLVLVQRLGSELAEAGFVGAELASAITSNFAAGPEGLNRLRSDALLALAPALGDIVVTNFAAKLNDALISGPPTLDANQRFALELLLRLDPASIPDAQVESLSTSIGQQIQNSPSHASRGPWLNVAVSMLERFSSAQRAALLNLASDTLAQADATQTSQCLDLVSEENRDKLLIQPEIKAALNSVASTYSSNYGAAATEHRLAILRKFSARQLQKVLLDIVNPEYPWDIEVAASLLVEMLQQQQITPAMFARSAHSLLDRFVRGALPQRIPVLMTLVEAVAANAPASGNTQFMHLLADLSGELLKHDAVSGANALTRLASVLSNELKASVGDEIAEDLAAVERAGDSLVSYTPHLDVLAAYGNALSGEARRKLSDLVTRLLGPAKDDNEIRIALNLLRRVPGIRKTAGMKSNLSRLVDHAEFGELARELVGGR